jgi:glucose-fructose oxidoreductase
MAKAKFKNRPVRYGVVGLGHIAQVAVLPAFKGARKNSQLTALVTGDPKKAKQLSRKYGVSAVYDYSQFDELLSSDTVDALYIALPNHMHREFTVRGLDAGLNVLCEKPLALTEEDCVAMSEAAARSGAKLMTAYRLHFEEANLEALKMCKSGKLGKLRYFSSDFTMQVTDPDNIRLKAEDGGGPIWDIGIYCINAARSLFQAEPIEVFSYKATAEGDRRFSEVPEMMSVNMRFPDECLATFTCSFGADTAGHFRIVGTKGTIELQNAYEYAGPKKMTIRKDEKIVKIKTYKKVDQFAPELLYFSDCVLRGKDPEPDAAEGLNDVRVIRAINESAETGRPVAVRGDGAHEGPHESQAFHIPGHEEPGLVNVTSSH